LERDLNVERHLLQEDIELNEGMNILKDMIAFSAEREEKE